MYRPSENLLMLQKENVAMSKTMEDSIKRWTAKRKTALVIEIIQGKTTVSEASRSFEPDALRDRELGR